MKVFFRADASRIIGSGHIMRCLTLAAALAAEGAQPEFICRELDGNLCDYIAGQGYPVHRLPGSAVQKTGWQDDAQATIALLEKQSPPPAWLVVDHYGLDAQWEAEVGRLAARTLVIDDLANRPHCCDLLLDQNHVANQQHRYDGLVDAKRCSLLLGTKYALLRPEFALVRKGMKQRDGQVRHILIFFGGMDAGNETSKALEAIRLLDDHRLTVDVVVGAQNPHRNAVEAQCASLPQLTFHCQVSNMAELLAKADLVIGSGGTSTWERCCLGAPSLTLDVADNQYPLSAMLAQEGRILYLGPAVNINAGQIRDVLAATRQLPDLLRFMSQSCAQLVDGLGATRVVQYMLASAIELRAASWEDAKDLHQWRNAEENRMHSFNQSEIPWESHERWLTSVLADPARKLLIGYLKGEPAGVLRYDVSDEVAEISIYLVPGMHGRGLGRSLIEAGTRWMQANMPAVKAIRAEILSQNKSSESVFLAAGFERHHSIYMKDLHRV